MTTHTATRSSRGSNEGGTTLRKEISDFLIEFSIGVHRYSMYPPDHPSLVPAAGNVFGRLQQMLRDRAQVSLGVAKRQLIIDGVATTDRNPVLTDLARRLHSHQIGAITFKSEATAAGIEGLLRTLAEEADADGEPLGLREPTEIPTWPGVRLIPIGYDDLELVDADGVEPEGVGEAMRLWLGLAQAATSSEEEFATPSDAPDERQVADHINRHRREQAYDQVIVGYLLQLSDELARDQYAGPGGVRGRVSKLIAELDDEALERILVMGGDLAQRRQFVVSATKGLDTAAAMKVLTSACQATGQEVSRQLVRVLSKLARQARDGGDRVRTQAGQHFNDKVAELLENWTLESPNPDGYVRILDDLSEESPLLAACYPDQDGSALSLVQMALEVDSHGPMVDSALDELLADGRFVDVVPLIEGAQVTETGRKIKRRLSSPEQLERLVELDDVDSASLEALIGLVGVDEAIQPLLKVLTDAESRGTRRTVFDGLAALGAPVVPYVPPFLEDDRWYVLRNMLALVAALPERPTDFTAAPYIKHDDPRVRREAVTLALAEPDLREKALSIALRDDDERVVRTALADLANGVPEAVVPILVSRVVQSEKWPAEMTVVGIRALGDVRSRQALTALTDLVTAGRGFWGRPRLQSPSRPVLTALEMLASNWEGNAEADRLIKAASKSRNIAIRRSVEGAEA